ncbi:MAG TPA: carboxypeptidase-like regulatory domain-containing protein, partial [Aquaticitalea sp.]|nr:carboxypeptidase-like regulatory domain-containing protein [Aquaticitalea sp.]
MKSLLQIFIVIFFSVSLQAQQRNISGTVTSKSDGLPLPGVNVIVKGTSTGTQTNFDGNYTILATEGDNLSFSMIGMITTDVVIGKNSIVNVVLSEDSVALDEIVVTAYGSTIKQSSTSSVSTVRAESSNKR